MEQFWSGSAGNRNKGMTEQLRRCGVIKSQKVIEIMETVDRGLFVPEGTPAYVDSPMSIGYNATISAPHMHAMCLELLRIGCSLACMLLMLVQERGISQHVLL